jgi:hypothetical protein
MARNAFGKQINALNSPIFVNTSVWEVPARWLNVFSGTTQPILVITQTPAVALPRAWLTDLSREAGATRPLQDYDEKNTGLYQSIYV